MKQPLILTIDFGTQSVRAGLFNKKGETVALIKKPYKPPYHSPKPGYAEQDPNYYYKTLCEATKELVERYPAEIKDVLGITMAFFRDSVVALDKENNVLRPAILWLDERRAEGKYKLPLLDRAIFKLVGMGATVDLNMKRSMAQWIHENEPGIYERIDKFMMISTYINMLLTGNFADSACCQAGHMPIDFKHGRWYKSDHHMKGQMFGISVKKLCKIVPTGEVLGTITKKASLDTGLPEGMKMFAGGSDKSAETLGLGVVNENMAAVSYGTACTIEIPIKKYKDAEPFLPSYPSIVRNEFNLDVQVYRGYWMLNWFKENFNVEGNSLEQNLEKSASLVELNKKMLDINPGSDGLTLLPYWTPGLRRPLAKGAIIGWSDVTTNIHVYRAIVEGIAYCLREGLEFFEKKRLHHKIESIRISGGGSQSDAICQITADIFGVPVSRIQTYECSSLGCAIAGFLAAGEFKDSKEAAEAMVHESDVFMPNEENHKKYDVLYRDVYLPLFPRLNGIYKNIKKHEK